MYDHVGLKIKDLDRSVQFYSAALAPLGSVLCTRYDGGAGFGPKNAPALWLGVADKPSTAVHVALRADSRQAVDAFYKRGIESGGRDNGPPGPRPDYGATYYAAFLIDPDGNNIEAVCLKA